LAESVPPGLAAVIVHTQAPLTIALALLIGEKPTPKQGAGVAIAVLGLVLIGASVGGATVGGVTAVGFGLALMSATSWAVGNILAKRLGRIDLNMVAWLSLIAPLPSLALSLWLEGPATIVASIANATWSGWLAIAYLAAMATLVAYLIWGSLLRLYPASAVTPFALLVPVISAAVSYFVFAERFGPLRLSGMALIVGGLAVIAWPSSLSPQAGRGSG
jgi:O-acetylserine/cysteine efflux transporter